MEKSSTEMIQNMQNQRCSTWVAPPQLDPFLTSYLPCQSPSLKIQFYEVLQ